jgi:ADP-ribose pyrophosphatase YjhB (NUDIX family)
VLARHHRSTLLRWAHIAWWGLARPMLGRETNLEVHQAVVLGPRGVLLTLRAELFGWELPGGAAMRGETSAEAARREVLEETGVEVEVERLVATYERTGFRPHVAFIHRCRYVSGEARPSSETPEVRWFALDALPDEIFPWFRGPLKDGLHPTDPPPARRERQGIRAILAGMRIDLRMRRARRPRA